MKGVHLFLRFAAIATLMFAVGHSQHHHHHHHHHVPSSGGSVRKLNLFADNDDSMNISAKEIVNSTNGIIPTPTDASFKKNRASVNNIFVNNSTTFIGASSAVNNMLDDQILCGYQGWFAFPGDGAPINKWRHWFQDPAATTANPVAGDLMVDLYPTTDEYDEADMRATSGIRMRDGSYAKFFSSVRPNVVRKHFQWMQTYGISGVFHLRFMQDLNLPNNRLWKTMVLRNVRDAAESTGRIFAVSYNIAGTTDAVLDDLKADWIKLVDEENITQSSQYIRQNGLPVLRIYGFGFDAVNVTDTTKITNFINWFQTGALEKYRVFLIGGVPSNWRTLDGDSRNDTAWRTIYDKFDGIHPWHVGRWSSISTFNTYHTDRIVKDADYCATKGIRYMPTMWPGFSWHNLKDEASPINQIPRLGGTFMWRQAYQYAAASNINTVWLAQFDECDEGTAIFKVVAKTSDLPLDGTWLALDADPGYTVPSDHYLRLAGEAQKMLDGRIPLRQTFPTLSPTRVPTSPPTSKAPTNMPTTKSPTSQPTRAPTNNPTTKTPTNQPTVPTRSPTNIPTTRIPTNQPTRSPTNTPTTKTPTNQPTRSPSNAPTTKVPTLKPTTKAPTPSPTKTKKRRLHYFT